MQMYGVWGEKGNVQWNTQVSRAPARQQFRAEGHGVYQTGISHSNSNISTGPCTNILNRGAAHKYELIY